MYQTRQTKPRHKQDMREFKHVTFQLQNNKDDTPANDNASEDTKHSHITLTTDDNNHVIQSDKPDVTSNGYMPETTQGCENPSFVPNLTDETTDL